ncbi:MAG: glycosyltransferase family 1 protein [Acidobacteria bacterium]|nr:glycosyltransferase family 1 protein [Acidobacteriota bacterium]
MKIVIVTYGTEGDTRPFAALCRGLMDAGHEAHLLADASTLGSARALAVPSTPLTGDIRATINDRTIASAVAKGGGFQETARVLAKMVNDNSESWLRATIHAAQGAGAILAVGLAGFAGLSAAEYLGIKGIGAGIIPITPTAAFPSPFLPPRWVPRPFNRLSHTLVNSLFWRSFREKTNAARAAIGLAPRRKVWTDIPMLYGASPHLLPPPPDWPAYVRLCGQWLVPSPAWQPPPALESFLAAGEPPVYVGFGSMTGFDTARLLDALIRALNGRRALFHAGWSGIDPHSLPGNFHVLGDTPHDWLFPRTAAVIHHGGGGTTHSAARAGVPSIVTPFAGDQFFWADRLRLAGVAPAAMDGQKPSAETFARALDFAARAEVRNRARELGEKLRSENGVRDAVSFLERLVAS